MGKFKLSDTELEIMNLLWETDKKMTIYDILTYFNNELDKNWQEKTLRTQILRLEKKGFISGKKENGLRVYRPLISETENKRTWSKDLLEELFNGSVRNFILALSGGNKLDEDTIKELRELIDKDEMDK